MTDAEKEPYTKSAKLDEERYKKQLKDLETLGYFMTEDGTKSTDLYVDPKKKYGEDCVVPKKPMSSYLYFTLANAKIVKEKYSCSHMDALKKCGALWTSLSAEEKLPYDE
mgnify:CR=1 FL=1